jgi:hypothetical protein
MSQPLRSETRAASEYLLSGLIARLGHHALWDALLMFLPPALALIYGCILLAHAAWFGQGTALGIALVMLGVAAGAIVFYYRPLVPNLTTAAHLVDERAGAQDHFLTLATIDSTNTPDALISRLRRETAALGARVELKRDFPYQPKRSAYWSLGVSLLFAILLPFLVPIADSIVHPASVSQRLIRLAEKMAQTPKLTQLSQELKALAAKLDEPKVPPEEKQAALKELEKKVEEQQKKEQEKPQQDLLGQAKSELKNAEQEQTASGQEPQKDQQQGGGSVQSNLPKDGQGESKQSQGSGGDEQGEMNAQLSKDTQQGKSAQGNPKEPGSEKNQQQQGDAKGNQPDPNQQAKDQKQDKLDKNQGGTKDGAGKNQASEEPPAGAPPSERFYQAGEGKDGVKNARYVKVQMPEDVIADSKGESRSAKESKAGRARSQVPVSNLPLPAHLPNAPTEKQQMPIEYRGIIR